MQEDNFHHRWDSKTKLLSTVTRGEANKVTVSCQVPFVSQTEGLFSCKGQSTKRKTDIGLGRREGKGQKQEGREGVGFIGSLSRLKGSLI